MAVVHRPAQRLAVHSADQRLLFVVSGPSGSGKESVIRGVLDRVDQLSRVTTYTTRDMRPGESEGQPYHFVRPDEFERLLAEGVLFESEAVYGSHRYGSPRTAIDEAGPEDLIIELDPNGYRRLREARPGPTIGMFLVVPDPDTLRARITARYPEADLDRRLAMAREQIGEAAAYDYVLVNDRLARCCADAAAICIAERLRRDGRAALERFGAAF